jgi:hypothetical protein
MSGLKRSRMFVDANVSPINLWSYVDIDGVRDVSILDNTFVNTTGHVQYGPAIWLDAFDNPDFVGFYGVTPLDVNVGENDYPRHESLCTMVLDESMTADEPLGLNHIDDWSDLCIE